MPFADQPRYLSIGRCAYMHVPPSKEDGTRAEQNDVPACFRTCLLFQTWVQSCNGLSRMIRPPTSVEKAEDGNWSEIEARLRGIILCYARNFAVDHLTATMLFYCVVDAAKIAENGCWHGTTIINGDPVQSSRGSALFTLNGHAKQVWSQHR